MNPILWQTKNRGNLRLTARFELVVLQAAKQRLMDDEAQMESE